MKLSLNVIASVAKQPNLREQVKIASSPMAPRNDGLGLWFIALFALPMLVHCSHTGSTISAGNKAAPAGGERTEVRSECGRQPRRTE